MSIQSSILESIRNIKPPPILTLEEQTTILQEIDKLYERVILTPVDDGKLSCILKRKNTFNLEKMKEFIVSIAKEDYPGITVLPTNVNAGDGQNTFWTDYETYLDILYSVDDEYYKNYNINQYFSEEFINNIINIKSNVNHDNIKAIILSRLIFRTRNNNDYVKFMNQYKYIKSLANENEDDPLFKELKAIVTADLDRYISSVLRHHIVLSEIDKNNLDRALNNKESPFHSLSSKYPKLDTINGFRTPLIIEQILRKSYLNSKSPKEGDMLLLAELRCSYKKTEDPEFTKMLDHKRQQIIKLGVQICSLKKQKKVSEADTYKCGLLAKEITTLKRLKYYNEHIVSTFNN